MRACWQRVFCFVKVAVWVDGDTESVEDEPFSESSEPSVCRPSRKNNQTSVTNDMKHCRPLESKTNSTKGLKNVVTCRLSGSVVKLFKLAFNFSCFSNPKKMPVQEANLKQMLPHTLFCVPVLSQMKTVLPFTMLHSVFHIAGETQRSRRLGLAHQECNGAAGEILHLSYSWGTTSVWLLHGDQLWAPNAINPTNHVCACGCVFVWCVCVLANPYADIWATQYTKTARQTSP